jgi:hypothetical protein
MRTDEEKGASRSQRSNGLSRAAGARLIWKKKTIRAAEADPVERAKFAKEQQTLPVEKLVFVDEFGADIAMTPAYARSPQGEHAEVSEPFNQGSNVSTIGSFHSRHAKRIESLYASPAFDSLFLFARDWQVVEFDLSLRIVSDG